MEHLRLAALGIIHNSHLNQATVHQLTKEVILNKHFRPQTSTVMNTFSRYSNNGLLERMFLCFLLNLSLSHKSFMTKSPSLELV